MTTLSLRARMSWPARLIAIMMSLLVMWLVVRNAALELLSEREPTAAMGFLPAGSGALAADGWSRVAASRGGVDPVARRRAAEALRREPVNASALALIGLAASADGRLDQARLLMEAARDRDPRLPAARYWLLDHDMRSGDYAAGLNEIGPALRLRPGTGDAIMALVMGLLGIPDGARAVRTKLAENPFWRTEFFRTQAYQPGHAQPLLTLLRSLPPASDPANDAIEQHVVLTAALIGGSPGDAYRLWLSRPPGAGQVPPQAIYDPDFRGLAGTPPFNWALTQNDNASAAMRIAPDLPEGHALALSYRGTTSPLLAEQYRLADAGHYRFQLRARRISGESGQLIAQLRCATGDRPLANLKIDPRTTMGAYQTGFDVPASCPALHIAFVGEAGDRPGSVEMQITGVHLVRVQDSK